MTILVTVGTSALFEGNPRLGETGPSQQRRQLSRTDAAALKQDIDRFLSNGREEGVWDPKLRRSIRDRLIEEHLRYWEKGDIFRFGFDNVTLTSAELSSTLRLVHFGGQAFQPTRLVLLHSVTEDGALACEVNEAVFGAAAARQGILPQGIAIERVGLRGFRGEHADAADELATATASFQGDDVVVNFTGGYKGLIPSITVVAIQRKWKLYYQHERSTRAGDARAAYLWRPPAGSVSGAGEFEPLVLPY